MIEINHSGNADKAAFGFLLAVAAATSAPISRNLAGFLSALVANFSPALAENFPIILKKTTQSFCFYSTITEYY